MFLVKVKMKTNNGESRKRKCSRICPNKGESEKDIKAQRDRMRYLQLTIAGDVGKAGFFMIPMPG